MNYVEVDLHDLTCVEVVKKIQKTIAKNPKLHGILAIHGYNNGTKIKKLLSNKCNLHNKRIIRTVQDFFNPGRTWIELKVL